MAPVKIVQLIHILTVSWGRVIYVHVMWMDLFGPTSRTYAAAQVAKKALMEHATNSVLMDRLFLQRRRV